MTSLETKIRNIIRNTFLGFTFASALNCNILDPNKREISGLINSTFPTKVTHSYSFRTTDSNVARRYPNSTKTRTVTKEFYDVKGSSTHKLELVDKIIKIHGNYAEAYVVEFDDCEAANDEERYSTNYTKSGNTMKRHYVEKISFSRTKNGWRPSGSSRLSAEEEYKMLENLGIID